MPYIKRIGLTSGFARFKKGQVIEDTEFLVVASDKIIRYLSQASSKEAKEVKGIFQDFSKTSKALQESLRQIGSMIYPTISDQYKVQFLGERVANLPDYGKKISPGFEKIKKYAKKNKAQYNKIVLNALDIPDAGKKVLEKIDNIDLAMRIISNKLS